MAELGDKIMVCIHCMTYNHEKYLADALEGFVMQKTDFPFVAVVIDDFSTDGTADVLREYEARFPEIIKAVYLQENYYSQHKSKRPFLDPWDNNAKYIALCEGDDYWTDPLKLQKQVDFMESHSDYSMCFHKVKVLSGKEEERHFFDHLSSRDYCAVDFYNKWAISTCSVLFRRESYTKNYVSSPHVVYGDMYLFLILSEVGKIRCLDFSGSTYRRTPLGFSSIRTHELFCRLSQQYRWYSKRFGYNKALQKMSRQQESDYIQYILNDIEYTDTWKYRCRYMCLHPQLIFSKYCVVTFVEYLLFRPYFHAIRKR